MRQCLRYLPKHPPPELLRRISVLKRSHGLNRCRYKGEAGLKRYVGLGIIADNLINIGKAMAK
jgi:IS5 family transposase